MAKDQAPASNLPAPVPITALDQYAGMLAEVPEAGADAWESIVTAIAGAATIDEIDAPWQADGLKEYKDSPLRVTAIRKMPSDFDGGWGLYLVVDAVDVASGEKVVTTTGSVACVAQLVKAHALKAFPVVVIPRVAPKPSRNGFFPMHLELAR